MIFNTNVQKAILEENDEKLPDIIRIITRKLVTEPLANAFSSVGSNVGGFFNELLGGARAFGGPVAAGVPYLVGERGPEIMVPRTAGSVVPNGKLANVTINNNVTVQAPGGRVSSETLQQLQAEAGKGVRRAMARLL